MTSRRRSKSIRSSSRSTRANAVSMLGLLRQVKRASIDPRKQVRTFIESSQAEDDMQRGTSQANDDPLRLDQHDCGKVEEISPQVLQAAPAETRQFPGKAAQDGMRGNANYVFLCEITRVEGHLSGHMFVVSHPFPHVLWCGDQLQFLRSV